mmetsp:Transcript_24919/g.46846  ORF Transcript_24919/g.46846 Transcript_24919/m.46846 type:complete len:262 (-) Transcript_24919:1352-2137(-)
MQRLESGRLGLPVHFLVVVDFIEALLENSQFAPCVRHFVLQLDAALVEGPLLVSLLNLGGNSVAALGLLGLLRLEIMHELVSVTDPNFELPLGPLDQPLLGEDNDGEGGAGDAIIREPVEPLAELNALHPPAGAAEGLEGKHDVLADPVDVDGGLVNSIGVRAKSGSHARRRPGEARADDGSGAVVRCCNVAGLLVNLVEALQDALLVPSFLLANLEDLNHVEQVGCGPQEAVRVKAELNVFHNVPAEEVGGQTDCCDSVP